MIYLINRYYDPTTDQFLSIDPAVTSTNQPYAFTNDDPLNVEDPLGLGPLSILKNLAKAFVAVIVIVVSPAAVLEVAKKYKTTVGVCLSGSAAFGIGASGSACIGLTGNGKSFGSLTGGVGGGSPNASLGLGLMASNAQTSSQLGRDFSYAGASVGEGLTIGGEGAVGKAKNQKTIVVGSGSLNIGGFLPLQFQAGESWTVVKNW